MIRKSSQPFAAARDVITKLFTWVSTADAEQAEPASISKIKICTLKSAVG